jgi:predicted O-methyltransferase YrrM
VDGHHDRDATIGYFNALLPRLAEDAVLVFDDIDWSAGMRDAWRVIRQDGRIRLAVDLAKLGVVVVGGRQEGARALTMHPW